MKGTLLGGFKVWIQDGKGLPLSAPGGRVKFYKANTAEPMEVYSSSAMDIPLGPIVYTDIHGYLPDVWLRTDFLYDVIVEKKVGDDPETWVQLYEIEDVGTIIEEETETPVTSTGIVSTISDLRDVDYTAFGTVYVLGYNDPGDTGERMVFHYDAESRKHDDGGSIILPNSKAFTEDGRWVQEFNGGMIDVRKFGAIPDAGADLSTQLSNCINYCLDASIHKRPASVLFLKPGKYSIRGNFSMDVYSVTTEGETEYLHYVINAGVKFNGIGSPRLLTLGRNTDVLTNGRLVTGYFALNVPNEFKGAIHAGWYGTEDWDDSSLKQTLSKSVIIGKDGMFPKTDGTNIVIYKDEQKVDLFNTTFKKFSNGFDFSAPYESANDGILVSLRVGRSTEWRFTGNIYATDFNGSNVYLSYTSDPSKSTSIEPGLIRVKNGDSVLDLNGTDLSLTQIELKNATNRTIRFNGTRFKDWDNQENEMFDLVDEFSDCEAGDVVFVRSINTPTDNIVGNERYCSFKIEQGVSYYKKVYGYGGCLYQFFCKNVSGSGANRTPIFIPMFNSFTTKVNT